MKYFFKIFIIVLFTFFVSGIFSTTYAKTPFIFGTGVHLVHRIKEEEGFPVKSWEEIGRELDMMSMAGIQMIRTDFAFSTIEPVKGAGFHFEDYDRMVNMAKERGIEILAILDYCRTGGGSMQCGGSILSTDQFHDEFADYAYATVNHFKDRIKYWEIWNEETMNWFWNPVNPTHYGKLLNKASLAVKRADPNAQVLFGGLHAIDARMDRPDTYVPTALKIENNGVRNFDIVKIISGHQYVDRGQGIPEAFKNNIVPYQYTLGDEIFKTVFNVTETGMRYWHTETGWSTNTGTNKTSIPDQANYIVRMSLLMAAYPLVDSFFQYDFRDDGTAPDKYEQNLGLVKNDFTPKPSYYAYKTMISLLKNASFREARLGGAGQTSWQYVFVDQAAGKTIHVVWATVDGVAKIINLDAGAATKISLLGDQIEQVTTNNGSLAITLNKRPVYYIVGGVPPTPQLTITGTPTNAISPTQTTNATPTPTSPSVTPSGLIGDIVAPHNAVDILDYNAVVADFGQIGSGIASDIIQNGMVDIFDYNAVVSNFGRSI